MNLISDLKAIDQQYVRNGKELNLTLDIQGHGKLTCTQALRSIPGKRLTCLGILKNRRVVVKFFYGSAWSHVKWSRCYKNALTLHSSLVSTPDILYAGRIEKHNLSIIIFNFLEDATRVDTALQNSSRKEKSNHVILLLLWHIADQHNKRIFQKDLHLGNFLLKHDKIYSIDTDKITTSFFCLFKKYSLLSLSKLILNIMNYERNVIDLALDCYCKDRKWRKKLKYKEIVVKNIKHERKKNLKKFSKKVYRNKDPFKTAAKKGFFFVCDLRYFDTSSYLLKNLDFLDSVNYLAEIFYFQSKYSCYTYQQGILHSFLKKDPLFKAWRDIAVLNRFGIPTPIPVLYLRKRIKFKKYQSLVVTKPVRGLTLKHFMNSKAYSKDQKDAVDTRLNLIISELENIYFKIDRINNEEWIVDYPNIFFNYMKRVVKANHSVQEKVPDSPKKQS